MAAPRKDLIVTVSFKMRLTPEAQDAWSVTYGTGKSRTALREDVKRYFTPDGTSAAEDETGAERI